MESKTAPKKKRKSRAKSKKPKREEPVASPQTDMKLPANMQFDQLVSRLNELQQYLRQVKAEVSGFKLGIEKGKEDLAIDFAFKATISS